MGQVHRLQNNGSRNKQYKDVELELWELKTSRRRSDSHTSHRPGSRTSHRSDSRTGHRSDSRTGHRPAGRTASRRPVRELQIQDITRYQSGRADARGNVQNIYVGNARPVQSIRRRRRKRRKVYLARAAAAMFVVVCLVMIYYLTGEIYRAVHSSADHGMIRTVVKKVDDSFGDGGRVVAPAITEDYIEINDFSRPGTPLGQVNSIFVHYTANPGTSAAQNRSYFANLALTRERSASAHLIIGYEGEIVQCIPFDEQAYAVMTRNEDSISIECCYTSEDGSFTAETYDALVHTLAWLTDKYRLSTNDILRHYDCGGKKCPLYYVEHEDAWERLLQDVAAYAGMGEEL